nr:E3 ubiquitin-protein ligase At1g63170-like [Ziziphus jujuba var. spinosa]
MVMVRSHYEYLHDAPLRVSIFGYALHCFLHIVCLHIEYRGRQQLQRSDCCFNLENEGIESGSYKNLSTAAGEDSKKLDEDDKKSSNVAKHLQSANTLFSFIWWFNGLYLIRSLNGQALEQTSPQLYWVCIVFLGFDVLFVVFCVVLACVILMLSSNLLEDKEESVK